MVPSFPVFHQFGKFFVFADQNQHFLCAEQRLRIDRDTDVFPVLDGDYVDTVFLPQIQLLEVMFPSTLPAREALPWRTNPTA